MVATSIGNIICVGRNYAKHVKELENDIPTNPLLFSKPTHALHSPSGQLALPFHLGAIHHEVEIVVKLATAYNDALPLDDIIEAIAIGIDWTARDVQSSLKEKGHPWLISKGFKGSAVLSEFIPFPGENAFKQITFSLMNNGKIVQSGATKDMIFPLRSLLTYIDRQLGTDKGDIIYTGTPEGVAPVQSGDVLQMQLKNPSTGDISTDGPLNIVEANKMNV
ncbi:fumarylacetoacetate hydrolase family protein [Pontibacillus litoralis]|uniref:Fumarylacetoacetate hydrolase n=1 Tax=Pontibacillus litoralis JSM 072002 TaxID=1385512 RepID=A0A0A5FT49_9BACI|nr:fumarylacetoacetate hydrolase family protein [Pontibacillus litoralis]KGX83946.1 fumarylacetoacetate hydrolase [Pontibacillus litoralis JSM 072002]